MKQDIQITDLIKKEKDRQESGLELIASENYVTDEVLRAMGSICTNKYIAFTITINKCPKSSTFVILDQLWSFAKNEFSNLFEISNTLDFSGAII